MGESEEGRPATHTFTGLLGREDSDGAERADILP